MSLSAGTTIQQLLDTLPQIGTVRWISVRPARRERLQTVTEVQANATGLVGDRYNGRTGKRAVTLIQAEHITAIASMLGREVTAEHLRRNIVVGGLNLLALKGRQFSIGGAVLEYTGLCHPCSFMEETLGPGGYNAVRGHGGITASVVSGGIIHIGDAIGATSAVHPQEKRS